MYVGWAACRVEDYLGVSRCYKCQGLGHIAKFCRVKDDVCGHCSQTGHQLRECPKKGESPECGLCRGQGVRSDHRINTVDCVGWRRAIESKVKQTDYGQ